ncbi:MAG: SDR family oxidoreductase [Ahrensia sp.]|nr:SDR family oxidoreductase [Ahrensia sp.]
MNNLAPGWFPTPMTNEYLEKGMASPLKTRIPMGRLGAVSDLDGAFLLLASDASKYMTGSTLTVDGGYSIIN